MNKKELVKRVAEKLDNAPQKVAAQAVEAVKDFRKTELSPSASGAPIPPTSCSVGLSRLVRLRRIKKCPAGFLLTNGFLFPIVRAQNWAVGVKSSNTP
jgi:hypothetical protein